MFPNLNHSLNQSVILLLALSLSSTAIADKIFLKNGEMIEGIIDKDTDSQIELDLGMGTTTINRTKIKSIERAGEEGNDLLRGRWQKKNFLSRQNVPQGLETVADGFKSLSSSRADLIQSIQLNASSDVAKVRDEIAELQKKMLGITLKLRTATTNDTAAYNAIVIDHNTISAELTLKQRDLDKVNKSRDNLAGQISAYLDMLASFKSDFSRKREEYGKDKQDSSKTYLFERIAEKLGEFEKECIEYNAPFTVAGKSVIVTAVANGNVSGKFILDTGASMVTLSQAFAQRANLSTNNTATFEIFLADGSRKTVPSASLDSFQVGNAKVGKLEALVVPSGPGNGMDGLVGMNFLQHFQIHLDAANGKLTLRQLKTK